MSRSRRRAPHRPMGSATINRLAIIVVVALAVAAVAALILLAPSGSELSPSQISSAGKIKGDPGAPVQVEEWGDFQ